MSKRLLIIEGLTVLLCAGLFALFVSTGIKTVEKRGPTPPPAVAVSVPINVDTAASAIRSAFNNWSDLVAGITQQSGEERSFANPALTSFSARSIAAIVVCTLYISRNS